MSVAFDMLAIFHLPGLVLQGCAPYMAVTW
jgi:hypothetical protein